MDAPIEFRHTNKLVNFKLPTDEFAVICRTCEKQVALLE